MDGTSACLVDEVPAGVVAGAAGDVGAVVAGAVVVGADDGDCADVAVVAAGVVTGAAGDVAP
jgi:hypothetical protein